MKFKTQLVPGKLVKRYKRFLADVELDNGTVVTTHCTNSGSMKSCIEAEAPVMLTHHNDSKRKTQYTWEMIFINNGWIGINTSIPNILAYEAIRDQKIRKLNNYSSVKREVKIGDSRLDIYAENESEKCFVEVKNVTLKEGKYALFPDAVTTRGLKHLKTLMEIKKKGMRAVMLYIIQRTDVVIFAPAKEIDPAYADTLYEAFKNGVEVIPLQAEVNPKEIKIIQEIPFLLNP
jgi:sugar fermentation stimulation protein A